MSRTLLVSVCLICSDYSWWFFFLFFFFVCLFVLFFLMEQKNGEAIGGQIRIKKELFLRWEK